MKLPRYLVFFALFASFLAFSACSKLSAATASAPSSAQTALAESSLATTVAAPGTGAPAAARPWYADRLEKLGFYVFPAPVAVGDFTAEALKGGMNSLSHYKGKIVLLNFWATWCPPCRAEMPSIQALWKKLSGKAFTVMAISVGEEKAAVEKFIAEQKYDYPIFLDPDNRLGTAFNASSIPTTYLVDKTGRIIAGIQGSREYDGSEVLALFAELAAK